MALDQQEQKAVREAAYYKWRRAGRPSGRTVEFWLEAEREFLGRREDAKTTRFDIVQEALEESFPASDAPAWMP